jgi:signal transduction histidine kinase
MMKAAPPDPPERTSPTQRVPLKPGRIGLAVTYLGIAAVLLRTLDIEDSGQILNWILVGEFAFVLLYTFFLWKYSLPLRVMYIYFTIQCGLTVWILSLWPDFDFITVYYIVLSYQASLVFSGLLRWTWIGLFIGLMSASLIYFHGILQGLALSLTNIVACIVIPAFIIVNHEIEQARLQSQQLLAELQDIHQQLQAYAEQADELTTIQERNRLARELHDKVSQLVFSISLSTRSAQLLLEKDYSRLPEQLDQLQEITANALAQLRSLITQLRPPAET